MRARALSAPLLLIAAGLAAAAIATAGQGPGDPTVTPGASASGATPVLRLKNSRFGKVIFEKRTGLVAYLFTRDKRSKSKCSGACAKAWPPIKTRRRPVAGKGLRQADVGTTKRRGGARMVTYKGHPLYFYEHDGPGEILCNDVVEFGGSWFVVKKTGKPG